MNLFKHQQDAIDFIIGRGGSGAILHEMGLGKTRTAIEIFTAIRMGYEPMLRAADRELRMFVICPLSLIEAAWSEDNNKFFGYSFNNLHKNFTYGFDPRVYIQAINYESLLSKSEKIIKELKTGEWLCILDESSKIKNSQSQITKLLLKMAPLFKYRIVMSGTPAPNNEMEYWPQMQFVAPGSLGTSMTAFRAHFFHLVNRYTGSLYAGGFTSKSQAAEVFRKCEYRITAEKREELMKRILPHCHLAKKKDCLDLPDMVDEIRLVEMEAKQHAAYYEMKRHLVAEIKNNIYAAEIALKKILLLREITSGFIYNELKEGVDICEEDKK